MLRFLAVLIGLAFVAFGILGFIPQLTRGEHLFDVFTIDPGLNIIYIATGLVAFLGGFSGRRGARFTFQWMGIIYGLFAILGFVYGGTQIFGWIESNAANTWLHVVIAVVALILGFGSTKKEVQ